MKIIIGSIEKFKTQRKSRIISNLLKWFCQNYSKLVTNDGQLVGKHDKNSALWMKNSIFSYSYDDIAFPTPSNIFRSSWNFTPGFCKNCKRKKLRPAFKRNVSHFSSFIALVFSFWIKFELEFKKKSILILSAHKLLWIFMHSLRIICSPFSGLKDWIFQKMNIALGIINSWRMKTNFRTKYWLLCDFDVSR